MAGSAAGCSAEPGRQEAQQDAALSQDPSTESDSGYQDGDEGAALLGSDDEHHDSPEGRCEPSVAAKECNRGRRSGGKMIQP